MYSFNDADAALLPKGDAPQKNLDGKLSRSSLREGGLADKGYIFQRRRTG